MKAAVSCFVPPPFPPPYPGIAEGWRPPGKVLEMHPLRHIADLSDAVVLYSPGPVGRAVVVPALFSSDANKITSCESTVDREGREAWDSVGDNGDSRGLFKVNKIHRERMASLGLDYDSESDRIMYAAWYLQPEQGWSPWWHCSGKAGLR